jgi:signal transduction histidine kinase
LHDDFLAKLAHDMGGALGAVMGYASILEDDPDRPLDDQQKRCLAGINNGVDHLERLITALRRHAAGLPPESPDELPPS